MTRFMVDHYQSALLGWLQVTFSDNGLTAISYVDTPAGPSSGPRTALMNALFQQLDAYFSGSPVRFSIAVDLTNGTPFQRRVWQELATIPHGQTRSYGDVARGIGNPRAARAVGMANRANRIPIVIPCHRVVASNGGLGGYSSGLSRKRALLELEGVDVEGAAER